MHVLAGGGQTHQRVRVPNNQCIAVAFVHDLFDVDEINGGQVLHRLPGSVTGDDDLANPLA